MCFTNIHAHKISFLLIIPRLYLGYFENNFSRPIEYSLFPPLLLAGRKFILQQLWATRCRVWVLSSMTSSQRQPRTKPWHCCHWSCLAADADYSLKYTRKARLSVVAGAIFLNYSSNICLSATMLETHNKIMQASSIIHMHIHMYVDKYMSLICKYMCIMCGYTYIWIFLKWLGNYWPDMRFGCFTPFK